MALSADKVTNRKDLGIKDYPVYQSTTIYKGGMVCIDSNGYAIPGADTSGLICVGVAAEKADNSSGSDGDIWVKVFEGLFLLVASSITQAMLATTMYVVDDETVDDTAGVSNSVVAGILEEYVSATSGWVRIEPRVA